jgi:hypothetical protein
VTSASSRVTQSSSRRLAIGDMFQMAGGVSPTGYLQRVQIEPVKPHTEKLILDLRLDDL